MKPNLPQAAWMLAVLAVFAAMLADIAGMLQVPNLFWLAATALLMIAGWRVMPSMAELNAAQRRPPK